MKRYALLIEASDVPGETKLKGAKADVDGFWKWLYSKPGGDWYDTEMKILNTPSIAEVKAALRAIGKVDFAFTLFAGHGYHSKELDLTKLCLRDGNMTVREVMMESDRSTVVIDACRNVMAEVFMESVQFSMSAMVKNARVSSTKNYREVFQNNILAAEKGAEFLFSCGLNESAGESPLGGYFSRSLLEVGRSYAEDSRGANWLPLNTAFDFAADATKRRNSTQNAQFEPGRRRVHFPFGV